MNGGDGVSFPSGTYTSSGVSNYALCQRYDSSNGCTALYDAFTANTQQSLRFTYSYGVGSGGPGDVTGSCMSGGESSGYKETILDWSANGGVSQWGACSGNSCGFSQSYNEQLPSTYTSYPLISITSSTAASWQIMMGSAYSISAIITDGSSTLTPLVTMSSYPDLSISPSSCNLDSSNPSTSSCTFIITPYSGTSDYSFWNALNESNSSVNGNNPLIISNNNIFLNFSATNNARINGSASPLVMSNINGSIITPYIYLPQTGQTPILPINPAPTGSDGDIHAGIPWAYVSSGNTTPNPRFTDDGCQVTDNLTGLIWIKDPSTVNSGNALTWYDALTTAASGTWCGQTAGSWRMPNFNEAMSLLNFAVVDNSTWLNNQNFNNISRLDHYWISTTIAGNNAYVFTMIFSSSVFGTNGIDKPNPIGKLFPVRGTTTTPALVPQTGQTPTLPYTATAGSDGALQEGTAWPSPRFTTGSGPESNCVTDKLTGLTWVRDPSTINSATKLPWSSALYIVGSGNWCGYSDWRVPNINEFRSLLNYAYSNSSAWLMYGTGDSTSPNCDGACFINISNNRYWTSTTNPSNISSALCLDIQGGGYSNFPKDGTVEDWDPIPRYDCAAWAVRGGRQLKRAKIKAGQLPSLFYIRIRLFQRFQSRWLLLAHHHAYHDDLLQLT